MHNGYRLLCLHAATHSVSVIRTLFLRIILNSINILQLEAISSNSPALNDLLSTNYIVQTTLNLIYVVLRGTSERRLEKYFGDRKAAGGRV